MSLFLTIKFIGFWICLGNALLHAPKGLRFTTKNPTYNSFTRLVIYLIDPVVFIICYIVLDIANFDILYILNYISFNNITLTIILFLYELCSVVYLFYALYKRHKNKDYTEYGF